MPKPFSQDFRNRVIDTVERGGMSSGAALRDQRIGCDHGLSERYGSREPVGQLALQANGAR